MRRAFAIQEERASCIEEHTLPANAGQETVIPCCAGILCEVQPPRPARFDHGPTVRPTS
jgi:hypothetical protein